MSILNEKVYALKAPDFNLPQKTKDFSKDFEFTFTDPYDLHVYTNLPQTLEELKQLVIARHKSKNYPLDISFNDKMFPSIVVVSYLNQIYYAPEHQISKDKKIYLLNEYFNSTSAAFSEPSLKKAFSLSKTLLHELFVSKEVVSLKNVEDRKQSCFTCPLHQLSKPLLPTDTSPSNKQLGICRACGCPLEAKIKLSIESIIAGISPDDIIDMPQAKLTPLPSQLKCWVLREASTNSVTAVKKLFETKLRIAKESNPHGR